MKFTFILENCPKPLIIHTDDNNLNEVKETISEALSTGMTLRISSRNEAFIARSNKISGVMITSEEPEMSLTPEDEPVDRILDGSVPGIPSIDSLLVSPDSQPQE